MKTVDLKKMHMISILWGFSLLGIIIGLTVIGVIYKKESKKYIDFENLISEKAKEYLEQKEIYLENETFSVSINELVEENFMDNVEINGNICDGYVEVTNENSRDSFKSYIDCKKYKTRGYKRS